MAEYAFYRANKLKGEVKKVLKSIKISPAKLVQGIQKHNENL
jgi:hypothetical protein